jgi:hypothetical protein
MGLAFKGLLCPTHDACIMADYESVSELLARASGFEMHHPEAF